MSKATKLDFETIENPYNDNLDRGEGEIDSLADKTGLFSVGSIDSDDSGISKKISGNDLDDLWIRSWIKSRNYKPQSSGFMLDGKTGKIECRELEVTSGKIRYNKTSFSDSVNEGYWIGNEGVYFGAAADATKFKFTIATGVIDFVGTHSGGTVGGQNVDNVGYVADPSTDITPTGLTYSAGGISTGNDGSQSAYATLTWDIISTNTFDHYLIRYKKASLTYYTYVPSNTNTITIEGLTPNIFYNFGIASVNKYGAVSTYSSDITQTTSSDSIAPATVTSDSATGGIQYIIVEWTHNTDSDLASYNIYRNTVDNSGTANLIGNCRTNYFVDGDRTGGTAYYYWIKAVDTSGNVSASFSIVQSATPRNVENADVTVGIIAEKILIDGAVYLSNWRHASGLTKIDGGNIYTGSVTTTQLNFTPVQSTDVIAKINASVEGITIEADNLTIAAATTFTSGWAATANAETDINVLNTTNAPAAANADVTQTKIDGGIITTGYITLSTAGNIKSGQTAYETGTGWWLGDVAGTPKFSIGNTTDYLKWDGSNVKMLCSSENAIHIQYGSDILLEHGGDIKFTSVTTPTACSGALAGVAGNVDDGTHYYKVTYINDTGETELGIASNVVTVADKTSDGQVSLISIPISSSGSTTSRKIYRTKAGGSSTGNYYLLTTINNNTATTYADNTADASLGVNGYYIENTTFGKIFIDNEICLSVKNSVLIGQGAGASNSAGSRDNIFIGKNAGNENTTGRSNIFIGNEVADKNSTGIYNIIVGDSAAGYNVMTGSSNTIIGNYSGYGLSSGYSNTFIGEYAGFSSTTGYRNIMIGRYAGYKETSSDKLFINNCNRTNEAGDRTKSIVYGVMASTATDQTLRLTASVGINTADFGSGKVVLAIANATTVPSANPTGGGVMYCEAGALKFRGSSGTITTIANA